MMNNNILLIIYKEIYNIDKILLKYKEYNIFIATYDFDFIEKMEKNKNIEKVFFLENMFTVFEVADNVKEIINNVNEYFKEYIGDALLFFPQRVENGETSQKIQDIIIVQKNIDYIINDNSINCIINFLDGDFLFEAKNIKLYAEENQIKYKEYIYNKISFYKKYFFYHIKPYILETYLFAKLIINKIKYRKEYNIRKIKNTYSIIMSLSNNSYSFYNAINKFIGNIEKHSNYNFYFLAVGIDRKLKYPEKIKNRIYVLEYYIKITDFIAILVNTLKNILLFQIAKNNLNQKLIKHKGLIRRQVIGLAFLHIIRDYGYRYRYKTSLERFLALNSVKAFHLDDGFNIFEGVCARKIIKDNYDNIATFQYNICFDIKDFPYKLDNLNDIDFTLAGDEIQKQSFLSSNVKEDKILLLESCNQFNHYIDRILTKKKSLDALNIYDKYEKYILVDISNPIRGYIHYMEVFNLIKFLSKIALKHPAKAFILKPHPGFKKIKYLKEKLSGIPNILIFDPELPILHFLNIADVVITKYSFIGIEAIILEKLVVSILQDNENRWRYYDEAALYIHNLNELYYILDNIDLSINAKINKIRDLKYKLIAPKNCDAINDFIMKIDKQCNAI